MKILRGILKESKEYYLDVRKKLEHNIGDLPLGSVKARHISGHDYYYLQLRKNGKVVHTYLGKEKPDELLKKISRRKVLKEELKKVEEALKILRRAEGRKRD